MEGYCRDRQRRECRRDHTVERLSWALPAPLSQSRTRRSQYDGACRCDLNQPKSNHARLVQYRARKQAADSSVNRLLTRAVLYRCPNVAWPDLEKRILRTSASSPNKGVDMTTKLEKEKPNDDSSYFDSCKEPAARSRRSCGNPGRASPSRAPQFSERLAHRFSGRRAWDVDRSAPLWNRTAPRRFRGWHARRR